MRVKSWAAAAAAALALLVGCGGDEAVDEPVVVLPVADGALGDASGLDAGPVDGAVEDAAVDAAVDMAPDMAPDMAGYDCAAAGQVARPFEAGEGGVLFGEVAGDFTAQTLAGPWTLSRQWSGCESYVFLNYFPDPPGRGGEGDALFATRIDALVADSPRGVHYFFTSYEPGAADREARMVALRDEAETRLRASFGDEEAAAWMGRLHFVTDRLTEVEGSVGAFARDYIAYATDPASYVDLGDRGMAPAPLPQVFGIDRGQRWDAGGSLSTVVGAGPAFEMAAWLGHFYDYHAALRARLAAEAEATTVVPLIAESVTDRIFVRSVELPAAGEMAGLDQVVFDVAVTCPHRNPFACSEWDRIARIEWCADEACAERYEVVRWITPYWRRGHRRWLMDASPLRGLMAAGGTQTFRIEMGPDWERATERYTEMSLRLSSGGEAPATGAAYAFGGGAFDAGYNIREPVEFALPAGAARVELVVIVSGHGQTEGDACAEWCDHRHHFSVNGTELDAIRPGPGIGGRRGCQSAAGRGASPGQWGNWAPGRAYWCPGEPVDTMRFDITAQARLGEVNTLDYRGSFRGGEPRGGDIALSSYVVWY